MSKPVFSIILATYGEAPFLPRFVKALAASRFRDFELLIADQNGDDRHVDLVRKLEGDIAVRHLRVDRPGLSYARNTALKLAAGKIICFPDDDCFYGPEVLSRVSDVFSHNELEFVCCSCRDEEGGGLLPYTPLTEEVPVTILNFFKATTSIGLFVRADRCFQFDENFGLGARFPSCEEMDFTYQMLAAGRRGRYFSDVDIFHPRTHVSEVAKVYRNSIGHGAFIRKHLFTNLAFFFGFGLPTLVFKPFVKVILNLVSCNIGGAGFYWATLRGRLRGFVDYA